MVATLRSSRAMCAVGGPYPRAGGDGRSRACRRLASLSGSWRECDSAAPYLRRPSAAVGIVSVRDTAYGATLAIFGDRTQEKIDGQWRDSQRGLLAAKLPVG